MPDKPRQAKVRHATWSIKAKELLRERRNFIMSLRHARHRELPDASPSREADVSHQMVRKLLGSLAPVVPERNLPVLADDLEAVSNLIGHVADAVDSGILTDTEANSLIDFVAARFVERRFEGVLHRVFVPSGDQWFLFASEHHHGGKPRHGHSQLKFQSAV